MFTMKSTKIDFIKHDILQSTPTFSVKYNALSNAWRNTLISLTNGTRGERQTPDHCEPCHLPFEGLSLNFKLHHRISRYISSYISIK